ncbi:hypothetical protein M9Y10_030899 [Tritrichomonas musculus]|uniref:BZIP domain-containing protein n=1 Tax=Tritrichomonas musculus TaxID=1915356 RepID=A0ABR2H2G1_9EUKA
MEQYFVQVSPHCHQMFQPELYNQYFINQSQDMPSLKASSSNLSYTIASIVDQSENCNNSEDGRFITFPTVITNSIIEGQHEIIIGNDHNQSISSLQHELIENEKSPNLKERNRIAARKWRQKKESYLSSLELDNEVLRQKALKLYQEMQSIKIENGFLGKELQYFQDFMSSILKS